MPWFCMPLLFLLDSSFHWFLFSFWKMKATRFFNGFDFRLGWLWAYFKVLGDSQKGALRRGFKKTEDVCWREHRPREGLISFSFFCSFFRSWLTWSSLFDWEKNAWILYNVLLKRSCFRNRLTGMDWGKIFSNKSHGMSLISFGRHDDAHERFFLAVLVRAISTQTLSYSLE